MPIYVVTYVHPDETRWLELLDAHLRWIEARLGDGVLIASGPCEDAAEKSAILVLRAQGPGHVEEIVASDPYVSEGLVSRMTVVAWSPVFGALAGYADGS